MHSPNYSSKAATSPVESTTRYLDEHHIAYKLFGHDRRFSAAGEARASGVAPHHAAKSVLVRTATGYQLAVIPASERLDLHKLRRVVGDSRLLRLATEREMAENFPELELGALPPFSPLLGMPEVVDRRLLDDGRVICNAGDHEHSLLVDPRDIVWLERTRVGDVCED